MVSNGSDDLIRPSQIWLSPVRACNNAKIIGHHSIACHFSLGALDESTFVWVAPETLGLKSLLAANRFWKLVYVAGISRNVAQNINDSIGSLFPRLVERRSRYVASVSFTTVHRPLSVTRSLLENVVFGSTGTLLIRAAMTWSSHLV